MLVQGNLAHIVLLDDSSSEDEHLSPEDGEELQEGESFDGGKENGKNWR